MSDQEYKIQQYFRKLWPLCRSITGNDLRKSFEILQEIIPLQLYEVPSGTRVFDWEIPLEWNIEDAWLECPNGSIICKFKENNLHVVNYSIPVNTELSWEQLEPHLYTVPALPNAVPYITSYYKDHWGFCLSENAKNALPKNGIYKAVIKSEKKPGSLTYGEYVLPGKSEKEILFSSYLCHPSMAVNELSGPLVLSFLYDKISKIPERRYTYRFVIAPETIGIIAYLSRVGQKLLQNLEAGYVITCVGHEGKYTYKRSRQGNSLADRIAEHVLHYEDVEKEILDFAVGGSDERQFCAPGFNFPVGSLMRTMYKQYPEYHTSFDNESILSYKGINETVDMYFRLVRALEINQKYTGKVQYCEPFLGKRDLYPSEASWQKQNASLYDLLHFLAYADGERELLEVAEKQQKSILEFEGIVSICRDQNLI